MTEILSEILILKPRPRTKAQTTLSSICWHNKSTTYLQQMHNKLKAVKSSQQPTATHSNPQLVHNESTTNLQQTEQAKFELYCRISTRERLQSHEIHETVRINSLKHADTAMNFSAVEKCLGLSLIHI